MLLFSTIKNAYCILVLFSECYIEENTRDNEKENEKFYEKNTYSHWNLPSKISEVDFIFLRP